MTLEAAQEMELGQIVDFVITYNNMMDEEEKHDSQGSRKATQADWDSFFGG